LRTPAGQPRQVPLLRLATPPETTFPLGLRHRPVALKAIDEFESAVAARSAITGMPTALSWSMSR